MAYIEENQSIKQVERDTESHILEMRRQLELGTEEAKEELAASRKDLREAAETCKAKIESLSEEAQEQLEDIQSNLGKLNYLLAEETLQDIDGLDRHSGAIVQEMRTARDRIAALEMESREQIRSSYGEVENAWYRFLRCLELIRIRLKEAEHQTDDRFADERAVLRQRLAENPPEDDKSVMTALWEGLKEHKRWIIAFFQSPLEASPTPPPPGYASTTDTSSDHGTGG